MKIVGCDLHTRYQQIAMLDQETGELIERRLEHEGGEARGFYASLEGRPTSAISTEEYTSQNPRVPHFSRSLREVGLFMSSVEAVFSYSSVVGVHVHPSQTVNPDKP